MNLRVVTRNGIIIRNSQGRITHVERLTNNYPAKDKFKGVIRKLWERS